MFQHSVASGGMFWKVLWLPCQSLSSVGICADPLVKLLSGNQAAYLAPALSGSGLIWQSPLSFVSSGMKGGSRRTEPGRRFFLEVVFHDH